MWQEICRSRDKWCMKKAAVFIIIINYGITRVRSLYVFHWTALVGIIVA